MWACLLAGGFWGLAMFSIGLYAISAYGSGLFVSLSSPLLVVSTSYYAYKKGLEQLARFMQVGEIGWGGCNRAGREGAVAKIRVMLQ